MIKEFYSNLVVNDDMNHDNQINREIDNQLDRKIEILLSLRGPHDVTLEYTNGPYSDYNKNTDYENHKIIRFINVLPNIKFPSLKIVILKYDMFMNINNFYQLNCGIEIIIFQKITSLPCRFIEKMEALKLKKIVLFDNSYSEHTFSQLLRLKADTFDIYSLDSFSQRK